MKKLKASLVGLFMCLFCGSAWAGEIFVLPEPTKVIFLNSYVGAGPVNDQWHEIRVEDFGIPRDATGVFLQGTLNITGPMYEEYVQICNAYFFVAAETPKDRFAVIPNWFGMSQSMVSVYGQGNRETISTWVPVKNGKFAWKWTRNTPVATPNEWPYGCSFGGNVNVQAYVQ